MFLLLLCACATTPTRATSAPAQLDAASLVGRWHVIASTFPMWKDRHAVTFGYGVLGPRELSDQVAYLDAQNAPHAIIGVDTQHADVPTHFTWRGEGLLALFTSEWDIVAVADDASWVVLSFGATLATPAGVDVIARSPNLDEATLQAAIERASVDPEIRARTAGLFRVQP